MKQNRHGVAESNVLRSLTNIERQGGFPFSGIPTGHQNHAVFQFQSGQSWCHRLTVEHRQIKKPTGDLLRLNQFLHRRRTLTRMLSLHINRIGLRAVGHQLRVDSCLIANLHQKSTPSMLHEFAVNGSGRHLHTTLRIDVHLSQTQRIQQSLQLANCLPVTFNGVNLVQSTDHVLLEWRSGKLQRLSHTTNRRHQRLPIDTQYRGQDLPEGRQAGRGITDAQTEQDGKAANHGH